MFRSRVCSTSCAQDNQRIYSYIVPTPLPVLKYHFHSLIFFCLRRIRNADKYFKAESLEMKDFLSNAVGHTIFMHVPTTNDFILQTHSLTGCVLIWGLIGTVEDNTFPAMRRAPAKQAEKFTRKLRGINSSQSGPPGYASI